MLFIINTITYSRIWSEKYGIQFVLPVYKQVAQETNLRKQCF